MNELRGDMAKSIKEQMGSLARLRHCHQAIALDAMIKTFKENAGVSADTSMESYWLLMVDVAQHEVVPA
jgi:hypothetical protein